MNSQEVSVSPNIPSLWFRRLRPYLSLTPFDVSTEEGRAHERQRRALLSSIAAVFGKVISVGTSLITIPLTLNYLGSERFGLWMTISSVIAMLAFADLGIGNGLLNAISEANGKDDTAAIRRHISSAAIVLSLISALLVTAFSTIYTWIPWASLFNVHSVIAAAETGPAVFVFAACFALNVPATIVQRTQLGLQLGFATNLWQAASSVSALIAVLIMVKIEAGLPALVLAQAGTPVLVAALNGASFFGKLRPDLMPRLSLATRESALTVMRTGALFLILQLAAAVLYSSDNIVIAHVLGADAVATYAVPDKLFGIVSLLLSALLAPLWPAYAEALSRGDGDWVRKIFRRSLILSALISAPLSLGLVLFGQWLINWWIGHRIAIPFALLLGMGIWKVVEALGNSFAMFLNGANVVGFQVKVALTTAVTAIMLKFYLVKHFGVSGSIYATIICFTLFALTPNGIMGKETILKRTK